MKTKINIDPCERYPFYYIEGGSGYTGIDVEISEEKKQCIIKAFKDFEEVQEYLAKLYKSELKRIHDERNSKSS